MASNKPIKQIRFIPTDAPGQVRELAVMPPTCFEVIVGWAISAARFASIFGAGYLLRMLGEAM